MGPSAAGLYAGLDGGGSLAGTALFFCRKARKPRSRSSQRTFRKKTPESVNRIRLMNMPSTVVIDPATRIQAIPTRGMMPSRMEISSIRKAKLPPQGSCVFYLQLQGTPEANGQLTSAILFVRAQLAAP